MASPKKEKKATTKNKRLELRLTAEELETIKKTAEKHKKTKSALLLYAVEFLNKHT